MIESETTPAFAKTATSAPPAKLIVVSNRLPISLTLSDGQLRSSRSSGGLASAITGLGSTEDFAWVGWPGCVVPDQRRPEVEELLLRDSLFPVYLTEAQEQHYYRDICNQVLWPLCHYFAGRVNFKDDAWQDYVEVNRLFADAVLARATDDTRVWVHDFHLMLVPSMLRAARPDLEIGFFFHIPFPSSEIYRLLPVREQILTGLLGADYIGFHTNDYVRHFRSSCLRILGLESEANSITHEGRRIGIGANPIGIDVDGFTRTLRADATAELLDELEQRYEGRKLILGVERLDYSKGITHKLKAFERFLARDRERAKEVTLLQVLVPSRLNHPEYQGLKSEIEELVGRLNGEYGGPGITPVEYVHRNLSPEQLVALYRFAHVGLVTPVRDGMNLVAQEFVLCQRESSTSHSNRGILMLSEFAGAAHYLGRSILVNPWNVEQMADGLETALAMPDDEKRERMNAMAEQVVEMDCHNWAVGYLDTLGGLAARRRETTHQTRLGDDESDKLRERFARAPKRVLALDYDGTLRELTRSPEEAAPTEEIREILTAVAEVPETEVHLISGRDVATMQKWFGDLPVHLCAEHGYTAKPPGGEWSLLHDADLSWMPMVEDALSQICTEVPGTMVESKSCALAWHYRMADLDYGVWRAHELLIMLEENLANLPVEVIPGHRVIEVRAAGVNKGSHVGRIARGLGDEALVLCAGDDRTDLDMYRVLPRRAVSIHIGSGGEEATYSMESPARFRALLRDLVEGFRTTVKLTV